jgi:hypothetical protein
VPSLAQANPEFARLTSKRTELQLRLAEAEREIEELRARKGEKAEAASARVVALIDGEGPAPAADDDATSRLREATVLRRDLQAAIAHCGERIEEERGKASAVICERVAPHYREAVAKMAEKAIELYRAAEEYKVLRDALTDADVLWTAHLRPMAMPRVTGDIGDRYAPLAVFLIEAAEYGFLPRDNLPACLAR